MKFERNCNLSDMKPSKIKELMINSLDENANVAEIAESFEREGLSFDFSEDFENKVFDELFGKSINVENENTVFSKSFLSLCNKVSMIGAAAIIIFIISIFFTQGEISLNSLFGLGKVYDEGMIYLLGSVF